MSAHRRRRRPLRALLPHADLLTNAGSLFGSSVVTAALGFAFWWLAARTVPIAEVGAASAAVSAMTFLGTAGMFGLGTLLIGAATAARTPISYVIVGMAGL